MEQVVRAQLAAHPYPLVFVTVSGAHLYGFESADSDVDLRGCHVVPARAWFGLDSPRETVEVMDRESRPEADLVTHDARKFFLMLLKNNGYVLEQVMSPLVVHAGPAFEELRAIARVCITKNHHFHFSSFAHSQWKLVVKSGRPTVKGLLYTYRVLLAGIHLMRTGEVESNLRRLNESFGLSWIDDLIARKVGGQEKAVIEGQDLAWHEREQERLQGVMEEARAASALPEKPSGRAALDDLLVRLRMGTV
ncbi:MAG: nucleotidyltransferase domain-containing protein [Phycisphaeraceae bacterium]|nr:nucleotidyltransferase domain-containing protein [Phycisphaeraceae bacterium]